MSNDKSSYLKVEFRNSSGSNGGVKVPILIVGTRNTLVERRWSRRTTPGVASIRPDHRNYFSVSNVLDLYIRYIDDT